MALNKIHITYLKEYIDQLIIGKGVLKIENPERVIEKVKTDYLVKLAFRFYSKLNSSEKYAQYIHDSENALYLSSDKEYQPIMQNILTMLYFKDPEQTIQCLNCGADITIKELEQYGESLPLCPACEEAIGAELDIWERVFG